MELNMHILAEDLAPFSPQPHLSSNRLKRTLKYALPCVGFADLRSDVVYVARAGDVLDDGFTALVPDVAAQAHLVLIGKPDSRLGASRADIIWVASDTDSIKLLDFISQLFIKYNAWQTAMQSAVLRGRPIEAIGRLSSPIFEKPIIVYDRYFQTVFYNRDYLTHPELPQRKVNSAIPASEINSIKRHTHYFYLREPYSPESFRNVFGYSQLCYNLFYCSEKIGVLCIQEGERELNDRDWALIGFFGKMVEQLFANDASLDINVSGGFNDLIARLLNNELVTIAESERSLRDEGWEAHDRLVCMAIRDESTLFSPNALHGLAKHASAQLRGITYAIHGSDIVLVCNLRKAGCGVEELVETVRARLEAQGHVNPIGVSMPFYSLSQLLYFYRECCDAMALGVKRAARNRVFYFEDYLVDYLADLCRKHTIPDVLFPDQLKRLMLYDQDNHTDYCELLMAYLRNNQSVQDTALDFHVHRNTVRNKLQRIEALVGIDYTDSVLCAELLLSFALLSR